MTEPTVQITLTQLSDIVSFLAIGGMAITKLMVEANKANEDDVVDAGIEVLNNMTDTINSLTALVKSVPKEEVEA